MNILLGGAFSYFLNLAAFRSPLRASLLISFVLKRTRLVCLPFYELPLSVPLLCSPVLSALPFLNPERFLCDDSQSCTHKSSFPLFVTLPLGCVDKSVRGSLYKIFPSSSKALPYHSMYYLSSFNSRRDRPLSKQIMRILAQI